MQTITAQWCCLDNYMLISSNINIKNFLSWRDKKCQVCLCSTALVLCVDCTFLYDLPALGKIPHCENWWKLSFRKVSGKNCDCYSAERDRQKNKQKKNHNKKQSCDRTPPVFFLEKYHKLAYKSVRNHTISECFFSQKNLSFQYLAVITFHCIRMTVEQQWGKTDSVFSDLELNGNRFNMNRM